MAINLNKAEGKKINLSKAAPSLTNVTARLWWSGVTAPFDLDVTAFVLSSASGSPAVLSDEYMVFYGSEGLKSPDGSVWKTPDERAAGTEELYINLPGLPASADEVSIVVTIYEGAQRAQTFGQIPEAGIKLLNSDTGEEIAFFDLDAQFTNETAVQVGSLFKQNGEFVFQAVGAGYVLDLGGFAQGYGVNIG